MNALIIESFKPAKLPQCAEDFLTGIRQHKKFIAGCNRNVQNILWAYVKEREDEPTAWRHPNLVLPYLINEVFALSDVDKLRTICSAHIACDHFTHLMDDLADEQENQNKALVAHASHLMLSRGRKLYLDIVSNPIGFVELFEQYLEKAMIGEQWLWNRRGNLAQYNENDFEMLRARGGMFNICFFAYCDVTDRWRLWQQLEHAFGDIIVAVQLLDDVVDVEIDYKNGMYTAPLAAAISEIDEIAPTWEDVEERLLVGAGWTDTMVLANSFLKSGCSKLQGLNAPSIRAAISGLQNNIDQLMSAIEQGRGMNLTSRKGISGILQSTLVRNLQH